jgi:hypothetical protein
MTPTHINDDTNPYSGQFCNYHSSSSNAHKIKGINRNLTVGSMDVSSLKQND